MGFFTLLAKKVDRAKVRSQSLSGWDGVFHRYAIVWWYGPGCYGRNPFQGGMGFFTCPVCGGWAWPVGQSQSLSGWDGVFHPCRTAQTPGLAQSQSLSGWDGVFHVTVWSGKITELRLSQSLSGWDGVFHKMSKEVQVLWVVPSSQSLSGWDGVFHGFFASPWRDVRLVAIPFRVGWGFSLSRLPGQVMPGDKSQSLSGWDGVFHGGSTR